MLIFFSFVLRQNYDEVTKKSPHIHEIHDRAGLPLLLLLLLFSEAFLLHELNQELHEEGHHAVLEVKQWNITVLDEIQQDLLFFTTLIFHSISWTQRRNVQLNFVVYEFFLKSFKPFIEVCLRTYEIMSVMVYIGSMIEGNFQDEFNLRDRYNGGYVVILKSGSY